MSGIVEYSAWKFSHYSVRRRVLIALLSFSLALCWVALLKIPKYTKNEQLNDQSSSSTQDNEYTILSVVSALSVLISIYNCLLIFRPWRDLLTNLKIWREYESAELYVLFLMFILVVLYIPCGTGLWGPVVRRLHLTVSDDSALEGKLYGQVILLAYMFLLTCPQIGLLSKVAAISCSAIAIEIIVVIWVILCMVDD